MRWDGMGWGGTGRVEVEVEVVESRFVAVAWIDAGKEE